MLDGLAFNKIRVVQVGWLVWEIRLALESLVGEKALGPDGFNLSFTKICWDIVGPDFVKVFKEFNENGKINKCLKKILS